MSIKNISVIGAGQMGSGIAQVAAQSGYKVLVVDSSKDQLDKSTKGIQKSLEKLHSKGVIAETADVVKARIETAADVSALKEFQADLVIEAVTENFELKKKIFTSIDEICGDKTILASNTSSISITKIAACTQRPDKVIGMHFMNPVPIMKLVELIRGIATSEETYKTIKDVSEQMQKTTIVARDMPGFVVNRILMPMINEAAYALMEGLATEEDIDAGMKLGTNQPMGPLTLADFIGLDTCLYIMEVLHEGLGDTKYRPCPLLRNYVEAGWLGKKSGRGFYKYDS